MNLINGEALEQLKLIPNKSVDFVCIDPPYELEIMVVVKTILKIGNLLKIYI